MFIVRIIAIIFAALALQACGTLQHLDTAQLQAVTGSSYGTTTQTATAPSRPTMRTPSTSSRTNSR